MTATTTPQHCAHPDCDQPPAAPGSDRGAKPKYCGDPAHNPLSAHRERRRKQAETSGQRAEETGGQPVTLGITRAVELVRALEKLAAQHADTLTRAIAELRAVGDIESAEARLAEEIQRRRDAEAERDDARAEREQADDAAAQAITRMEQLERELAETRTSAEAEARSIRASAAAEIKQARDSADRDISAAREHAARQVTDAETRAGQAGQDATRARHVETAAITRAKHAQAAAADETARIRADHHRSLDQLTTATNARITAIEETRDALRIRAERAESDLDTARTENQRLAEQLTQAANAEAGTTPTEVSASRPRTASRAKKTPAARASRPEA